MDQIMRVLADSNRQEVVTLDEAFKRQLAFWMLLLRTCSEGLAIPDPDAPPPPWAENIYTDAAGGTLEAIGRGCGGVWGAKWFYLQWSRPICSGSHSVEGKKVARKLAALELVGPLVAVCSWFNDLRGKHVVIWVDNAGSVGVWKKGYSNSCQLCSCIATTIHAVAAAAGATIHIKKITRCSNTQAAIADNLSKANFKLARSRQHPLDICPSAIPLPLLAWAQKPIPDPDLASKILKHIARDNNVLGYSSTTHDVFGD
jgi:hypothetical protein